jgi:hypothetical protein
MSELRRGAIALALAVAVAQPVRAQSVAELLVLKARNDSALAVLEATRPAPPAPTPKPPEILDTVRVGAVTLISAQDALPMMRASIAGADANVRRAFGDAGDRALVHTEVTAHLDYSPTAKAGTARPGSLRIHLRVGNGVEDLAPERWPADSVDAGPDIALGVSRAIRASLDSTMRMWMPVPRPPGADSVELGERAFRVAVTSGSAAVRRCLAGNDEQCESALGMISAADPVRAWYDPVDYPDLLKHVANLNAQLETEVGTSTVQSCLREHDTNACRKVVARIPASALHAPMPDDDRALLFLTAMGHGGAGAFDRLAADSTATPVARLARAAGLSEHDLLAEWRKRVTVSTPTKALPTFAIAVASLIWIGGCFGAALRGTPWN